MLSSNFLGKVFDLYDKLAIYVPKQQSRFCIGDTYRAEWKKYED